MHIHILGICGTFMGGLAALAREAGHTVTGCDTGVYPPMSEQLRALGITLTEGYSADVLDGSGFAPDMFVVGNVVSRARLTDGSARYPLMEAILNSGLPYTSGPAWLAEHVLQGRHVLAVAGTHGKTSTASMLAWILESAGLQPGFLIGGVPLNFGISARLGANKNEPGSPFVIEADEYDTAFFDKRSKFVHYRPRTAVLNNLEFDHADIFDNLAAIERQFHHLVRTVPSAGCIVVNQSDAALQRVLAVGCWSRVETFGEPGANPSSAGYAAVGEPHDFAVLQHGVAQGRVQWTLSGVHNQNNALAAIAAAAQVGVNVGVAAQALGNFGNVRRRMEVRGVVGIGCNQITVIDDFAHHPTAMQLTLEGLRRQFVSVQDRNRTEADTQRTAEQPGYRRILAIFEVRSNTMKLGPMAAQLPASLAAADLAFCHAAGLDWDAQSALSSMGKRIQIATSIDSLLVHILEAVQPGDTLLCMSNGSFSNSHNQLLDALQSREDAQERKAA